MSIGDSLRRLEKGFAWSFLGFVLAAVFGAFAVYTEFYRSRAAKLTFDVLANTPVLSTHEDVPALRIFYRDIDIRQTKQSLSVLAIRIQNDGDSDILNVHYDTREPVGLTVSSGHILEPRVTVTTSEYLRRNAKCTPVGDSSLAFEPVILEPGEFYVVRLLVLHPEGVHPQVRAQGKVAGVRQIEVVHSFSAGRAPGLLARALSGDSAVQAVRLPSYAAAMLTLLALVIGAAASVGTLVGTWRRRRHIKRFTRARQEPVPPEGQALFKLYEREGPFALMAMSRWLRRDPLLRRTSRELAREPLRRATSLAPQRHSIVITHSPVSMLIDAGLLRREEDRLTKNSTVEHLLQELLAFLPSTKKNTAGN